MNARPSVDEAARQAARKKLTYLLVNRLTGNHGNRDVYIREQSKSTGSGRDFGHFL